MLSQVVGKPVRLFEARQSILSVARSVPFAAGRTAAEEGAKEERICVMSSAASQLLRLRQRIGETSRMALSPTLVAPINRKSAGTVLAPKVS